MNKRECPDDFERVVLPHLDAAHNLARWLVRDPAVAEDVAQEAFLRALKYFASFRGGSGRTWLLQIVRNVSYSHFQTERSRKEVPFSTRLGVAEGESVGLDMDVPDPGVGPEAILMHREELGQVVEVLNAMPAKLRECIIMRELKELSYKDIAQITDAPIGTVMSRLSRARRVLIKAAIESSASERIGLASSTNEARAKPAADTSSCDRRAVRLHRRAAEAPACRHANQQATHVGAVMDGCMS
jgi:RNA polymerase sigma-70 factor, ECF subfamily